MIPISQSWFGPNTPESEGCLWQGSYFSHGVKPFRVRSGRTSAYKVNKGITIPTLEGEDLGDVASAHCSETQGSPL